jgi:Predicted membrane protein|tara:strand:+ start:142397 stop:142744 length:348 start_codon:yes stop_codon:yes gene_type:complete
MTDQTTPLSAKEQEAKSNAFIAYVLLSLGFFTGATFIAAGVWAYLNRQDCSGTRFDDHYDNIIKVFWVGVVGSIVGVLTTPLLIGVPILIGVYIYNIIKIVKGFSTLTSNKAYAG